MRQKSSYTVTYNNMVSHEKEPSKNKENNLTDNSMACEHQDEISQIN